MVNSNEKNPRPLRETNPDQQKNIIDRRRVTERLPALLNTDLIKKFFAGSADHLYQPEVSEKLAGFIGQIPSHFEKGRDFYINEPTTKRRDHQLEPTAISIDPVTGDLVNIMFYEDILNLLRFQGGLINNQNRLFDTEFYSWAPCIDLDKLMNFTNYFWFPAGPDVIRISILTDIGGDLGTLDAIVIDGIEFFDGMRVVFENDVSILFNDRVFIVDGIGVSFNLLLETELFSYLWDDPLVAWDEGPWDGPEPELAISFETPDYIVVQRGSRDGSAWSAGNRWYHRDELNETQLSIALERQALRPIIEFCRDLELFNHGTFGRAPVTVRDDVTTDPDLQLIGLISAPSVDGIIISNGDTILFTNSPSLQGNWDIGPWDNEDPPDGEWDEFINVVYSAPAFDIVLGLDSIATIGADFVTLGFVPGMRIVLTGTPAQDGEHIIDTVSTSVITLTAPFVNITGVGIPIPNNITIIEQRTLFQNRVFKVDGIGTVGGLTLTLIADGQNEDGSPANGDQMKVLLGLIHQGNSYYWNDADNQWLLAQQKNVINQPPLFQLYDTQATKLQDPGKYPSSDFAGSKIFSYQINDDPRQPLDTILGIPLKFNDFGEIIFQNHLVTDRFNFGTPAQEIVGFYFHRRVGETSAEDIFNNDWHLSKIRSRQFLVDRFITDEDTQNFDLTLTPNNDDEVRVFVNGDEQRDQQWIIVDSQIQFFGFFENDDILQVRYFSSQIPETEDTTYEIPINLEGNPDNEEVQFIANSEFFAHFTSIIKNQEGLIGNANGTNNWRDTLQDRSVGTEILQHQAPMLKLMALGSNRNIDFMLSVRYVEREFSRFRNKFLRKINEFVNDGIHNETVDPPSLWVEDALVSINLAKTADFPFAFSGMGTRTNNEPTFIPSSPSRLGVFLVFKPEIFEDKTFFPSQNMIQMHDGSILVAFGDFRDDVILNLENNIFDSIPEEYKTEELPDFNLIDFVEAQFRGGDYSLEEFNQLLTPIIQRWATFNNLDLTTNEDFDQNDPFTFNYGKQGLPGYWRGIFKLFYDTDKPNTHPWEMFGFSQKPDYWDARYGLSPYTSSNTLLWDDMRIGTVADGIRQGVDERFARPIAPIPVDAVGNILDPIALGIATQPGILDAKKDWKVGDHAPVETVFRRGEFWSFAVAQISYLMKPARFIEFGWDSKLQLFRYENDPAGSPQWISDDTEDRKRHSEITVHGEELDDETIFRSDGIQQWITNFVVSNGQSITDIFGDVIRGLQPRLGHKMAGFINSDATRILADNFGLVPQEDIGVNLYRNRSIREEIYSGVIIERVGKGWAVFGYDVLDPSFKIIPPVKTSRQIAIDIGTIRVAESTVFKNGQIQEIPYGTVFQTQQQVYDFLISYGKFLESRGWVFDEIDLESKEVNNWRLSGKQYLFWSLGRWAVGSLISLSPSATKIKFKTERGAIQSIEQIINGVYSLLDRDGRVIQPEQTFVTRFNDELTITPKEEQAVYSARLFVAEFEHVLTFNNQTIFNDLIYNPLLKLRQSRFKLFTTRAGGWVGRFDAPGFIITENNLLPNYEKITNDFRRYFEIEDVVERSALQDAARRLFGFQTRDYLSNLLLSDDTQFQFMQGFIRKKGTSEVLERLLRSDATTNAEELQFFEEWALRLGEYGAIQDSITVELLVREEEIKANPQLIEFKGSILRNDIGAADIFLVITDANNFPDSAVIKIDDEILFYTSKLGNTLNGLLRGQRDTEASAHLSGAIVSIEDNLFDNVLLIAPNDERWIRRTPDDENVTFPFRDLTNATLKRINGSYLLRTDIRTAGYPLESEVTHRVQTIAERNDLFDDLRILATDENLVFGDTVWVDRIENFYTINDPDNLTDDDSRAVFNFEFMVFRYTSLFDNTSSPEWEVAEVAVEEGDPIDISTVLSDPHGLNNGDLVMIDNVSGVTPSLIGSFLVSDIGFSFDGDGVTDTFATGGATLHETSTTVKVNGVTQVFLTNYEIGGGEITEITSTVVPITITTGIDLTINSSLVILFASNPATAIGTPGAEYLQFEEIVINGFVVTLDNGTSINDAIIDIIDAGIPDIIVEIANGALKISNPAGTLTLAEGTAGTASALAALGLPAGTIAEQAPTVDSVVEDINAKTIDNIEAENVGGLVVIRNTAGESITLSGAALAELNLTAGTFTTSGTNVRFLPSFIPSTGTNNITFRRENHFRVNVPITNIEEIDLSEATIGIFTEVRFLTETDGISTTGTVGTTYTNGEDITINGINIVLSTGTTVADAITDITTAAIPGITATSDAGALKISSSIGIHLFEGSGTALNELGFKNGTVIGTNRDTIFDSRGNPIPWDNGEYTFIDNASVNANGLDLWNVFQNTETQPTSPVWAVTEFDNVSRIQNDRIDVELFEQALIYNRDTNITDIRLNIWDPAKNLFPAQTLKEIDFKLEFNPSKYTDGDEGLFQIDPDQSWGEEHVGEVWWDLSTVEYTNYETSSNRERRNKWGRIAPGKSIDIYEWVRSTVPPTEWASLVESVAEQPEESFRYKPSGKAFQAEENDNPPFSQRIVINQLTGEEEVFFYFWVKNSETIPNVENRDLSVAQVARQLIDPTGAGIPWFAPINQNAMILSNTEPLLTNNDSILQLTFNSKRSEVNRHRDWILSREGDATDVPTDRFWKKMKDSLVSFDRNNNPVPAPNLEDSRKIGNFIRPRQTWFVDREQAGKIFIDCVNLQLSQECIVDTRTDLFNNLFNQSDEPTPTVADDGGWSNSLWSASSYSTAISLDKTVCQFDFHVENNEQRDALVTVPGLSIGAQIFVDGIVETEGFWKVYSFDGIDGLGDSIFTEICSEAFRVADFWQQVDFFAEGFDINTEADTIVDTLAERDAIPNPVDGTLVRVNDSNGDGTNLFALFEFNSSDTFNPWTLVGKQDCTIEFDTDLFFDSNYGNIDVLTGLNGRDLALKEVVDALRNNISTDLEQNLLFYKMIKYVHSEQLLVDWVFKTTYIKAFGLNKTADQDPIFRESTTNDLISFIEEAKPYHTKLRDFVINEDIGLDIQENNVTDFDKPVIFDTLLDDFRVLDPNDPDDIEIMLDPDAQQNDWFLNFQTNPSLIRQINTTIKFDRVSCGITGGWDPIFGWDLGPNEDWDLGPDNITETAAERIVKFYQPHPLAVNDIGVINEQLARVVIEEKDIAELISGCNYKGTFVEGGGMIIDINDLDTFLNPSQSAEFIGDGIEDTFAIPLVPVIPTTSNVQVYLLDTGWSSGGFSSSWSSSPWSTADTIANGLQIEGVDYTVDGGITEVTFTVVPPVGTRIIVIVGVWLLANPGAPIDPSAIIVDGNLLNDPFTKEGHPEELVLQTTGEALSICVDTEESISPAAPAIAFRLFLNNQKAKEAHEIEPLIKTALSEGITAGQTTVKVDDIARFPPFGVIIIVTKSTLGNFTIVEHIEYDSVDKLTRTLGVVLDGRGVDNTDPAEHFLGDIVLVLNPLVPKIATFDSFRISDAGKTTLAQPLDITDTEIELTSVAGLPKQLVGQEFMTTAGVIWIGNERIEYFRRDGTTLKHIRRGTQGTSSGIPSIYDINGDLISDYRTGTFTYLVGTVVTDGTKKQEIPGGYEWAPEPNGLQFSDSILAKFLLDKPGSCPDPVILGSGWSSIPWSDSSWSS